MGIKHSKIDPVLDKDGPNEVTAHKQALEAVKETAHAESKQLVYMTTYIVKYSLNNCKNKIRL